MGCKIYRDMKNKRRTIVNEEIYRLLFEKNTDAIFIYDPETAKIIEANKGASILYGYSSEELLGKSVLEFSAEVEQSLAQLKKMKEEGEIQVSFRRHKKKDGSIIFVEVKGFKISLDDKEVMFAITKNITDKVVAENALKEQNMEYEALNEELNQTNEELSRTNQVLFEAKNQAELSELRLKTILDSSPFPVAVVDVNDDNILYWSTSAKQIFGHNPKTTQEWYNLAYPDPQYQSDVIERWKPFLEIAAKSSKAINTGEYRVVCKDGSTKICEIYAQFIPGNLIVSLNDITDRKQAELIIKNNETKLRGLFENINAGIVVHAADTSIVMSNKMASEILELSGEQMQGKNATDQVWHFLDENNNPIPLQEYPINKIISTKKPIIHLTLGIIQSKGGIIKWVLVNGFPILNEEREIIEVMISFFDITELKKTERQLKHSEQELKKAQEITHIGSWYLDIETNQVQWTEELFKMYGFDPSLPVPPYTEHMKLFTAESWELLSTSLANTQKTGIPYELELKTIRKDGTNGWMWVRGEAVRDNNNKTIGLWGAAQDITENKQIQIELSESKAILQAALDNSQAGIAIADAPDGKLRYVNDAALTIRGKSKEEIVNGIDIDKYVESWQIFHFDGTPYRNEEVPLARALLVGEKCSEEFIVRRDNGEERIVWANAAPIKNAQNKIVSSIVLFLDITQRKKAEVELQKHRENLEELVKERTKDLEDRNKELERFSNLFVNREYRIKELRDEIEKLKNNS